MRFRPCIDIHNGRVKQIVGSSLQDQGDTARENFVSEKDAAWYADLYRRDNLPGGHVILLNPADSPYYEATRAQAKRALGAFPGGLQIGGGVTPDNAAEYLDAGASHVIVTSYVFRDGRIDEERLTRMVQAVGKEHLVLDVSCRKKDDTYYIVTDRWQKFTDEKVTPECFAQLSKSCDEFLIHAADVEGKSAGIAEDLVTLLGTLHGITVTYAGGVRDFSDLVRIRELGGGKVDVTIGSALDLFGGPMSYREVIGYLNQTGG